MINNAYFYGIAIKISIDVIIIKVMAMESWRRTK
jgi:hypothetical protein